ncbi:MAG TPA: tRNA pseudouridine(38-40) synthase TruA [Candidatus Methanoperedens sp.]
MRTALKVAYIGTEYNGFKMQKDLITVESEIARALKELDLIRNPYDANLMAAGWTDRNVHAQGQVIAFDTDNPDAAVPRIINARLPSTIWTWAWAHVRPDFNPGLDAISQEYRYILCGEYNISQLRNASRLLKGTHDFSNFSMGEKERCGICTVEKIEMRVEGDFTIMDIRADHFLRHMARKIATAMKMMGRGVREITWLEQMLNPDEFREGLESAPGYGLIFKNADYKDITWKEDQHSRKTIHDNLEERFLWHGIMAEMLKELKENMIS